ncbi:hypothetical protein H4219_000634 [Mycoemilia scoparia]|uniref:PCI domain-containing protein n=1 Tax=Mycoemilia scoparia TaxID=417184 RepID=A0A9W8A2M7_9FUNG|nr:hypothetical protein H4219_000634 [Mycoemilia scoparia]
MLEQQQKRKLVKIDLNESKMPDELHAARINNLQALAFLYSSISLGDVARKLEVTEEEAEEYCANAIADGEVSGRIDQQSQIIIFEGVRKIKQQSNNILQKTSEEENEPDKTIHEILASKWSQRITRVCGDVEKAVDMLYERHPEYISEISHSK